MSKNVYSMQAQSYMLQVSHTQWMWGTLRIEWNVRNLQQLCHDHYWVVAIWAVVGRLKHPPSPLMEEQDADREGPKDLLCPPSRKGVVWTDPPDDRMSLVVTNVHEHIEVFELQPVNMWYTYVLKTVWVPLGIRELLQNACQITCNNFSVWKTPHKPSQ